MAIGDQPLTVARGWLSEDWAVAASRGGVPPRVTVTRSEPESLGGTRGTSRFGMQALAWPHVVARSDQGLHQGVTGATRRHSARLRAVSNRGAPYAVTAEATAIRPFQVEVPEEQLAELRRRIEATRWPSKELVGDRSQGVQLATLQALARYWATDYDWRRCEARLNALPQFTTEIDGVDIHFIHVRSRHENALPLIMTHGWPGSVIELLETVGPLTDPTAHGGTPEDAFHLVLPSLPGYGFSGEPAELGWDASPSHARGRS